tara:strand:- start:349 stop:801 length:453 start_codon:yes stop_codon:yes gene_type:complete
MDELIEPVIKAYLSQISSAMKISEVLSQHANSEEIRVDDLIGGLVYRLMVPMSNEEIEDSLNHAEQILDNLDETDSDEEQSNQYDLLSETYPNSTTITRKIKSPLCNCDICSKLRVCLLNYKNHECNDSLSQKFKDSIDSTCEKHKLYIG